MRKKLGLLTLHGMGRQEPDYACDLFDRLRSDRSQSERGLF